MFRCRSHRPFRASCPFSFVLVFSLNYNLGITILAICLVLT